jgi:hypothetical protein
MTLKRRITMLENTSSSRSRLLITEDDYSMTIGVVEVEVAVMVVVEVEVAVRKLKPSG